MKVSIFKLSLSLLLLTGSTALASPLDIRTDQSLDGTMYCGTLATGSKTTARGLLTDLDAGANGKISGKTFTIAAGACQRVHCWDTTGIYVCNDASHDQTLIGNDVWAAANQVFKNCCWGQGDDDFSGVSGQKFIRSSSANYNVVIAYGNCNHAKDVRPYNEGGWGVNNACSGGILNPYGVIS